jgi:D-amino-acid oxidase
MPPPATPNLPTPDFTFDPNAPGACIAGVRPFRNGSYRLEGLTISNKFFVHNYGHGGAGITLSWGCAAKVRDIVKAHLAGSHETKVAVLGAGVMGLTAATRLLDLGLQVTIDSDRLPAQTTSAKAGGQRAVSVVEYEGKKAELTSIIKIAYKTFKDSIGQGFGVYERPNYTASPSHNLDVVEELAPGLIPPRKSLSRMPFEGHTKPGFVYQTLLIEPPVFLARLEADLRGAPCQFCFEAVRQQSRRSRLGAGEDRRQLHRTRIADAVQRSQDDADQGTAGDAAGAAGAAISLRPGWLYVSAHRPCRHRRDL